MYAHLRMLFLFGGPDVVTGLLQVAFHRAYDPPCAASRKRRRGDKPVSPRSAARQRRDRRRAGPEAALISVRRERTPGEGRCLARLAAEGAPGHVRRLQGDVRAASEQPPQIRGVRTKSFSPPLNRLNVVK